MTREAGGQRRGVRTQVEGQVVKVSPAPLCRTDGEKQQVSRSQKHGEYSPWAQPYLDFALCHSQEPLRSLLFPEAS